MTAPVPGSDKANAARILREMCEEIINGKTDQTLFGAAALIQAGERVRALAFAYSYLDNSDAMLLAIEDRIAALGKDDPK